MKYSIKKKIRYLINRWIEFRLSIKEFMANQKIKAASAEADLQGKILVIAHSLEKGMGLKNMRVGYGKQKANKLLDYLFDYQKHEYDTSAFAYQEALAVLGSYFKLSEDFNEDIRQLLNKYSDLKKQKGFLLSEEPIPLKAGYHIFKAEQLNDISNYPFDKFLQLRHSIRDYKDELVPKEVIEKAIQLANMSPSACNRQSAKVYCTKDRDEARYIDSLITGTLGFKESIPNFAILTENRAYFTGAEQFQWYTNGGIYTAYLSLALHSLGLVNCIMQWYAFYKTENEIKRYFGISKNEAIIAVIGFGYCPNEVKYIDAQRKKVSETLVFKD